RDGLSGLADLSRIRVPAGVDHRARGGDGAVAAERLCEVLAKLEALGFAETAPAGDEDVGTLDVDVGAALLAALDHRRLVGEVRVADLDVDDLGRLAGARLDLERVDPADDDPQVALVLGGGDLGVAEDRALGDELVAVRLDRGDLHRHAGVAARREAGADLKSEQAAAEQGVAVSVLAD